MYGNCEVCGARFGTVDGKTWLKPCKHIQPIDCDNCPAYNNICEHSPDGACVTFLKKLMEFKNGKN